jgi:hypothetical protein
MAHQPFTLIAGTVFLRREQRSGEGAKQPHRPSLKARPEMMLGGSTT